MHYQYHRKVNEPYINDAPFNSVQFRKGVGPSIFEDKKGMPPPHRRFMPYNPLDPLEIPERNRRLLNNRFLGSKQLEQLRMQNWAQFSNDSEESDYIETEHEATPNMRLRRGEGEKTMKEIKLNLNFSLSPDLPRQYKRPKSKSKPRTIISSS